MEQNEGDQFDPIAELTKNISEAQKGIEDEFARSDNTWLSCFGTRVFQVSMLLEMAGMQELFPPDTQRQYRDRLEEVQQRLHGLHKEYPTKDAQPPAEIKAELLEKLNVLA